MYYCRYSSPTGIPEHYAEAIKNGKYAEGTAKQRRGSRTGGGKMAAHFNIISFTYYPVNVK